MTETTPTVTEKTIYSWSGQEPDCPKDIVVNAGNRPIIIAAQGIPEVARDQPRIDVGDRRQGVYYIDQIGLPLALGLARITDLPEKRILELEKQRQIRTGDRPADWILEARERAKRGEQPAVIKDKWSAMTTLQRAAGVVPGTHGGAEV